MEQIIKINVPDGKDVIYNEQTHTIEFVDKKPPRSKTWEEFVKNNPRILDTEHYISSKGACETFCGGNDRTLDDKCYLNNKEDAEGIAALIQLTRLHDEWVGNWKPDYTDSTEKWNIYFLRDNLEISWSNSGKRFLTFPTRGVAKEFLDCFRDLIETAKKFI